jgi:transglutaminase/protease-like cytokinesis protein 3
MKRTLLLLIAIIIIHQLKGQVSFEEADAFAINYKQKATDVRELTLGLIAPFTTESEKARVIFRWITNNISYDINKFLNLKPDQFKYRTTSEKEQILAKMKQEAISETLKKRKGVCEDYSNLFAEMCRIAGLEVLTIEGAGRNNPNLIGKSLIKNDHQWNAIRINGEWKIVEPTWGAGNVDIESKKFTKDFKSEYFEVDPELAIYSHFPKTESDQLLKVPVGKEMLGTMPVIGYGFHKYKISAFSPDKGLIKPDETYEVKIILKLGNNVPEKFILIEGTRKTEIKPFKIENNSYYFGYNAKGKINKAFTIAGVSSGKNHNIITFKII